MTSKGDQGTVRALNRRLVLRLLREEGPASRTDLADRTGLSNGAVTRIVSELIDEQYLRELSIGASTGGRRPVLLDLDTSAHVVAGLKLMDDAILAVLVDLKGGVVADARAALRGHETHAVLGRAAGVIDRLLARTSMPRSALAGVGLCMPGAIDWQSGVCRLSPILGWRDVHVADMLHAQVGVPVSVDNDVNALAVAESLFGRGRRVRDFAVVTLGRGVGAGIVGNGSVFRGHRGGAGEFGHQVSEIGGRTCECGRLGCLEAYVSDHALLDRARERGGGYARLDMAGFLARVADGDAQMVELHLDVVRRLGVAIANLVNLLSPEAVILGGEAAYLTEQFVADVRTEVARHTFGGLPLSFTLDIDDSRNDRTAWARGAASLAMEHVFDPLMQTHGAAIA